MVEILSGELKNVDKKETLRYLGYWGVESLNGIESAYSECEKAALKAASPRACYATFNVQAGEREGELNLGFAKVYSKNLYANLTGCNKIAVFAATLGGEFDRLILKWEKLSPAKAVILQAMGAALIEQWCDKVNADISKKYKNTKPRFSCGYGDLDISLQKDVFSALSVTKNVGICLNESCFMTPVKSVTAIVGILNEIKNQT